MGAGQFRHFVRIEKPTKVSDGGGGFTVTWQLVTEEHALIERIKSFRGDVERLSAGGVGSNPIVRVHVRHHTGTEPLLRFGAGWRVIDVDTDRVMNINFAQDIEGRGVNIIITATENAPV